jgi:hypothetical protein
MNIVAKGFIFWIHIQWILLLFETTVLYLKVNILIYDEKISDRPNKDEIGNEIAGVTAF